MSEGYPDSVASLAFRLVQPNVGRNGFRYMVPRPGREPAMLLDLPGVPLDFVNTSFPMHPTRRGALRGLLDIPRLSTYAIGALINQFVAQMPTGQSFVNVGVWQGFTFLSSLPGNEGKTCVGIDNYSQEFGLPARDAFYEHFEGKESDLHRFYEMDYGHYFRSVHRGPIGVYLYDGEHSYENQLQGLQAAEPFLADGSIVMVDDTNWDAPRAATLDFFSGLDREARMLLDCRTAEHAHPTFWNGLMVAQIGPRDEALRGRSAGDPLWQAAPLPATEGGDASRGAEPNASRPLVSLVVDYYGDDAEKLEQTIDACLDQSWEAFELIVAGQEGDGDCEGLAKAYGGRVTWVTGDPSRSALEAAVAASSGRYLGLVDVFRALERDAVRKAIGFPHVIGKRSFWASGGARTQWMRRALRANDELAGVVPPGSSYVLINEGLWSPDLLPDRRALPFLQHDGVYWGRPADDEAAIEGLEELRRGGLSFIVFAWPAFWWLDYYEGFARHLQSSYRCRIKNERLIAFDLSKG